MSLSSRKLSAGMQNGGVFCDYGHFEWIEGCVIKPWEMAISQGFFGKTKKTITGTKDYIDK